MYNHFKKEAKLRVFTHSIFASVDFLLILPGKFGKMSQNNKKFITINNLQVFQDEYKKMIFHTIKYNSFFIKSYKSEVNELSNIQDNIKKINLHVHRTDCSNFFVVVECVF
ncbi:hypothetical protein BpHYR1_014641 [Brachionus plicatilis]|uniref:Uncharacterized protein n=1 Tax=Brachionus plicatilis TaxID=10195 RepID=A0A3M7QXD3_BRAPC|nr:hypothetical protein BpHYR1_014641 [Brachionus plicatilis]